MAFSRFSPVDNPEEWPQPGSSPGHLPPKGLGPFLPFTPADEPPLEPFVVPNQWSQRLVDAVVPEPEAPSLPEISPEDSISRAGQPRPIPEFRAEDMADPLRRRDYGRAGVTLRRADGREEWDRQRRVSRDDQVAARRARPPSPPPTLAGQTQEKVHQWVRSVPSPEGIPARAVSPEPDQPGPVQPPDPPRPRSAMKRTVGQEDHICDPARQEIRDGLRAGRSSRKKSRGSAPSPTGPQPPSPPQPRPAAKRAMGPVEQLCGPSRGEDRENRRAGRSGRKKSKGFESSSADAHDDDLYADPSEFWDPEDSDHTNGSEGPLQEVFRIFYKPSIVGTGYSGPSSVSRDSEPSTVESGSDVLDLTGPPEPRGQWGQARGPSSRGDPGVPEASTWGSEPSDSWSDQQGESESSEGSESEWSVRSGSEVGGTGHGPPIGQVWQARDPRRSSRGPGSQQGGLGSERGSGAVSSSGSGTPLQPIPDVFFSCSKPVRIPARGRARQVALPVHLYFRNKEAVSLPHLQQLMSQGSLVWLHWNLGWEDKNRFQ